MTIRPAFPVSALGRPGIAAGDDGFRSTQFGDAYRAGLGGAAETFDFRQSLHFTFPSGLIH